MLTRTSILLNQATYRNAYPPVQRRGLMVETISIGVGIILSGVGTGYALAYRYKVAKPDETIAMTGPMINGIAIRQRAFQWPFQTYQFIKMHPRTHRFELNAISHDFIKFVLPGTFIIGPDTDNPEMLKRYAKLLEGMDHIKEDGQSPFESIVFNTIDGCTRVFASQLTIDEINSDIKKFKDTIIAGTQEELNKLGLIIYNATIRELKDSNDSTYFHNRSQKKEKETENNAKIDIAEAVKKGTIGAKERDAHTRQQVAQFESDTIKLENERNQEMEKSAALLKIVQAEQQRLTEIAKIEAINAAKIRQAELEKEMEQKRAQSETERIRSIELSKAQAMAETVAKVAEGQASAVKIKAEADLFAKQKDAEALQYAKQKDAEAMQYAKQKDAEAQQFAKEKEAEAYLYTKQKDAEAQLTQADAHVYSKHKEAEGIHAIWRANSDGMQLLMNTVGNDSNTLIKYLMMEKGVYVDLAKANATAVNNLQPKISIWNTGSDSSNVSDTLINVIKTVIPLTDTIHQQTGMTVLDHLIKKSDNKVKDE